MEIQGLQCFPGMEQHKRFLAPIGTGGCWGLPLNSCPCSLARQQEFYCDYLEIFTKTKNKIKRKKEEEKGGKKKVKRCMSSSKTQKCSSGHFQGLNSVGTPFLPLAGHSGWGRCMSKPC